MSGCLSAQHAHRRVDRVGDRVARLERLVELLAGELGVDVERLELLEQVERRGWLPHGLALTFAAFTGARRGEVCGLRWADLDLEAGVATIRHNVIELGGGGVDDDTPKNHRERPLALDANLVARLRRHRVQQAEWRLIVGPGWRDRDLVFPSPDGDYLRPDVLSRRFRSYVKGAGLTPVRLHDLRHGHGTGLVEAGYDAKTVSSRLGHATTQFTLDVYVKPSTVRQAEAAQAYADRIAGARP